MRTLSRYFSDVLPKIPDREIYTFFKIHGLRPGSSKETVYVELRLVNDIPAELVEELLYATFSLYSRSTDVNYKLFLVVDARQVSIESVSSFARLLPFSASLDGVIEEILWVGVHSDVDSNASAFPDLSASSARNTFCDLQDVSKEVDISNISTDLGGLIDPQISRQFFEMRVSLEELLKSTRHTARCYMSLRDELKETEFPRGIDTIDVDVVHAQLDKLKSKQESLNSDKHVLNIMNNGKTIRSQLSTAYPLLKELDEFLYGDAVKRVGHSFDEVLLVVQKCNAGLQRRIKSVQCVVDAIEFFSYFSALSTKLEEDVSRLESLKSIKTSNISRLAAQVGKAKNAADEILNSANEWNERLEGARTLCQESCFEDEDRKKIRSAIDSMESALQLYRARISDAIESVESAYEIKQLLSEVYDWALLHAKMSDDVDRRDWLSKKFPREAASRLQGHVRGNSSSDQQTREEIEKLLNDCCKAMRSLTGNEEWRLEVDKEDINSGDRTARVLTEKQKSLPDIDFFGNFNAEGQGPIADQVCKNVDSCSEHAVRKLEDYNDQDLGTAGSSDRILGKSSSSLATGIAAGQNSSPGRMSHVRANGRADLAVTTGPESGASPTSSRDANYSSDSQPMSPALDPAGDSGLPGASQEFDFDLSSMTCLSSPKSRSSSMSNQSISETAMEILSLADTDEPPKNMKADYENGQSYAVTPQMRRSVSPAPTQYEIPLSAICKRNQAICEIDQVKWRRNSWASPIRFEGEEDGFDEHVIGAAPVTQNLTDKVITCMSRNTLYKRLDQRRSISSVPLRMPNPFLINGAARPGSARFYSYRSRPSLPRTSVTELFEPDRCSLSSNFQFLVDDCSIAGDMSYNSSGMAAAPLDFSIGEIEEIRQWLNPEQASDANFHIECTVVRDLLDSEIEYVGTLRLIVQDFLPEMARFDLPTPLRGKKSRLFGNIEKLFEFHAHKFLPQMISRLKLRSPDEPLALTIGKLFVEHAADFNLYSLYAKNKPKSDELMEECAHSFFSSLKMSSDLKHLLVRPIERIGNYTLTIQQLQNAAPSHSLIVLEILCTAMNIVSRQIRHGADLLAMERITGCDLNLREQGTLLRCDTMFVTEKRGFHSRKRMRSVFLFENCVVITKRKLCKASRGRTYDELKYKGSIQMTDCGLTEMVKDSKLKFELWFRKQNGSCTYILEAQTPKTRDLWVDDIRSILWKQAIRSRDESLREKANMGMDNTASIIHLALNSPLGSLRDRTVCDVARRPRSLISLSTSSCSSSNNATRFPNTYGFLCAEMSRVDETDEMESSTHDYNCSLPRFTAPSPPK